MRRQVCSGASRLVFILFLCAPAGVSQESFEELWHRVLNFLLVGIQGNPHSSSLSGGFILRARVAAVYRAKYKILRAVI